MRWITAGLGVLVLCIAAVVGPARAGSNALDVGDQAVVNLVVRGRGNEITIRTWDRGSVQIEYADENAPVVGRNVANFGMRGLVQQIPPQLYALHDREGLPSAAGALAPEEFPYAGFRGGSHDVVRIDAPENSRLIVTVPASTGILALRAGGSQTTVEGYRGANLFVMQNQGRVQVMNAATTAFVQVNHGVVYAADSTFDRLRVRGITAHDVFERCRSKQIEATSVFGSIVYDGGSFDPGLARFESQTGSIALGVTSAAQLNGRSGEGHVYTMFDRRAGANVEQHADGEAVATVGGGGPLVSAISTRGNVYFYDGSLLSRRSVAGEWRTVNQLFNTHRRAASAPAPAKVRRPGAFGAGGRLRH
ncbi:MAG TPA: hypothetical protein VK669_06950 [Candidatus Limnocylindrales bacterium]|nr:hypothetical protein [Candidatus Limnocylindrales bacterium]